MKPDGDILGVFLPAETLCRGVRQGVHRNLVGRLSMMEDRDLCPKYSLLFHVLAAEGD